MDAILSRPRRGKHKQTRSRSLPSVVRRNFGEQTEEFIQGEYYEDALKRRLKAGETASYKQPTKDLNPQAHPLDERTHLNPDERGAELGREARVWQVYVEETDKWDKEVIEEWDKSMDVLLVFAALFSAISASFVLESSSMLQQDPNEVSAAALLVISQAIVSIANGNSSGTPPVPPLPEQSSATDFVPSRTAIIINTLWYLSLGLSVATAFLAMLAKDCAIFRGVVHISVGPESYYGGARHHCETPSAVDIALQAIAGASQAIPKEPLLSCHATEQIIRRIASTSTDDKEGPTNDLYIRGLEFLGLNVIDEKQRITGDVEVMVWELKSKNERTTAGLIKDGSFVPNEDNLEAMRIGNSAASQSLRVLRGKVEDNSDSLYSITKLLSRHFESEDKQLHSAALHSLANATALHMSLSASHQLPPDLVELCMRYCAQLIREQASNAATGSTYNFRIGVVFIICVLLHGHPRQNEPTDTMLSLSQLRTRAWHAIHTLLLANTEDSNLQITIVWIACTEILNNHFEYGLDQETGNLFQHWCFERASSFVGIWGTPFVPSWSRDHKPVKIARSTFLTATNQVYQLVAASRPLGFVPRYLHESIHTILTIIACGNSLDYWQSQVCFELLSKFAFPRLNPALVATLRTPTDKRGETILSAIGTTHIRNAQLQGRFAATQIWLLLHLVGDSSSDDQRSLRETIDHDLEKSLQLQSKGYGQVKTELETFILETYKNEHRVSDEEFLEATEEGQPPSVWHKIRTRFLVWRAGKSTQAPSPRSGGFGRFTSAFQTDDADRPSQGKHQRLYIARVIQLILETHGLQGYEDVRALIEDDFGEMEPCFQRQLPVLVPLPPSNATSRQSLVATNPPRIPAEHHYPVTGHAMVDMRDTPGTSDFKDHNSG